ncbi:MAG: circadian clock protein KaiC [Verrucomicrobiota bacterium]
MSKAKTSDQLQKTPTGIRGLDEIANGGLPKGRTSLVCGNAGCGKTILAMEFIARGALDFGEPGVFMAFEETPDELEKNFLSLGFDLKKLVAKKLLAVDYVYIERSEIEETGSYDLDGLFIRLEHAIDSIGAKRVVLDTLEVLFAGLSDAAVLRAELRRLFRWLKEKGVTAIVTGERGEGMLTRYGLEEYVADCVILLDLRVQEQIATRRIRLVKYRGSKHGADEYPFLIDEHGLSILPLSSLALNHQASGQRISAGIPRLDRMLNGKGYFRGSTVLVSGTAGSGKTSLAAAFIMAACQRGERCLYFAFEESPLQIMRNMNSIGLNLEPMVKKGLLQFHAARPSLHGLEMHLVTMHKAVDEFKPSVVVLDPISNLVAVGTETEGKSMLTRLIDFLKCDGVTAMFTDLIHGGKALDTTNHEITSLIDTWISLRDLELHGELNRGLQIIKSRGMSHSNQIREFLLTNKGIDLLDVYLGPAGVLTGSARIAQAAEGKAEVLVQQQQQVRKQHEWRRRRSSLERQMAELRAQSEMEEEEEKQILVQEEALTKTLAGNRAALAQLRGTDQLVSKHPGRNGK